MLTRLRMCAAVLAGAVSTTLCAVYYVAADADSAAATGSTAAPFRTIQRAATRMGPGDTCLIRGGIYRETVVPAASGAAGRPVVFKPHDNETVFISAADPVTGWTKEGTTNIYRAPLAGDLGKGRNQLFVNGEMMPEARLPNIDAEPTDQARNNVVYSGNPTEFGKHLLNPAALTCNSHGRSFLPAAGSPHRVWVGQATAGSGGFQMHTFFQNMRSSNAPQDYLSGALVQRIGAGYFSDHGTVVSGWGIETGSVSSGWFYFSVNAKTEISENWGFNGGAVVLSGLRVFLDAQKEWALEKGTLYFRPPADQDPNTMLIEAKRRQMCFDLRGRNYIEVRGLNMIGGTINMDGSNNCTIDACRLRCITQWTLPPHYTNDRGKGEAEISIRGDNNKFVNSSIEYSAASGLWVVGNGNLVENCLITNCDYLGNYQVGAALGSEQSGRNTLTRCTMYNFGRSALTFSASPSQSYQFNNRLPAGQTFTYNNCYNSMFMADDGGTFYSHGVSGGGTEFAYNWMHDMVRRYNGHHLYFDLAGGYHFKIHHNVFWQEKGNSPNNAITSAPMRHITYNNTSISVAPYLPYGSYLAFDDDERGVNALWVDGDPEGWGVKDWKNHDFTLVAGSKAIDKGNFRADSQYLRLWDFPSYRTECYLLDTPVVIPRSAITGNAPDLGAYEYGMPAWKAGHDWGEVVWNYPSLPNTVAGSAQTAMRSQVVPRCVLTRKHLVVDVVGGSAFTVRVLDMAGRTVMMRRIDEDSRTVIPVSLLPQTVLLVRVSAGEMRRTYRMNVTR